MTTFDYLLLFVGGFNLGLNVIDVLVTPARTLRLASITNPEAVEKWRKRQAFRFYVFLLCVLLVTYRTWG